MKEGDLRTIEDEILTKDNQMGAWEIMITTAEEEASKEGRKEVFGVKAISNVCIFLLQWNFFGGVNK